MSKNIAEALKVRVRTPVRAYIGSTGCSLSFDLAYKANDSYVEMRGILNSKIEEIAENKPERMRFEKLTEFRIFYQESDCIRKTIDNDRDLFEALCCHGIYQGFQQSQLIIKIEFLYITDELNLVALIEKSLFGETTSQQPFQWYFQTIHALLPDQRNNKPNWELKKVFDELEAEKNKKTKEADDREALETNSDESNETYV